MRTPLLSDDFYWSNYDQPQGDKVDLDALIALFDSDKFLRFRYEPNGALIFRQVEESFEILSMTGMSDAVCELATGKKVAESVEKKIKAKNTTYLISRCLSKMPSKV